MSTYLLATMPTAAHVSAMTPIARALTRGGHRVYWYGGRSLRAAVEDTGATLLPMDTMTGLDEASYAAAHTRRSRREWVLRHYFLDPVPRHYRELDRLTGLLTPELLIASSDFVAAAVHAEHTGAPWISVGLDPLPSAGRDAGVLDHYQPIRERLGLGPATACPFSVISPLLHLQNGVPALGPPGDPPRQVRYVGALDLNGCLQGAILVTDRGFGTVQTAIAHGIPVLLTGGDPEVAERLVRSGAGLHLPKASARKISKAVDRILGEPSFRNAAMSLRDIYRGYDTPAVLLKQIEQTAMTLMLQR